MNCLLSFTLYIQNVPWNVFETFLLKVRILLSKFSHSVAAKTELAKWTDKALIHSCPTRWWSELDSVMRIYEILMADRETFVKVCEAMNWTKCTKCARLKLECTHLRFDEDDLGFMKKFIDFFTEFKSKSDLLGGESYTNVHLVFPFTKELSAHIDSFSVDSSDLQMANFATNFHVSFLDYFSFIIEPRHEGKNPFQPYYIACSMLYPLYYNGLTTEEREVGRNFLLSELKKMDRDVASPDDGPEPEVNDQGQGPSVNLPHLKFFSRKMDSSARLASSNPFSLLERQFRKDMEILELDALSTLESLRKKEESEKILKEDPTLYWMIKEEKYNTKLPCLALGLLSAPSSSVPSERLFSVASLLSSGNIFSTISIIYSDIPCR